jgi:hypothetical protein
MLTPLAAWNIRSKNETQLSPTAGDDIMSVTSNSAIDGNSVP